VTDPSTLNQPAAEVVAQIAANLARLRAEATSVEHLAAVQADLETHGLAAFFHGATQRLVEDHLLVAPAPGLPPLARAAVPTVFAPVAGVAGQTRQTWQDCIGSRSAQPLQVFRPTTLDELQAIVRQAIAAGCRVKAVGSGHSFSDVAVTRDFLIDTRGLAAPLSLARDELRPDAEADTLFETEAGIVVRDLNEALWEAGLGLVNLGGFDGQTAAGVMSTSTHGSGLSFGPVSSQVVSLTMVVGDGTICRIEPAAGITDPAAWALRNPEISLRQDDDVFAACQVGLGCLGVVYSLVLRARARYYLAENRTLSTWSRVKAELTAGPVLRDNAHYEVLVNPYETKGNHTCLVTRRNPTPEPIEPLLERPQRNVLIELAASLPGTGELLLALLSAYPQVIPGLLDQAMGALAGDYVDRSYHVFNVGAANDLPAYGSEIAFTLNQYLPAIERIFAIAAQRQRDGQAYLTSPFSVRFVQASSAYLSMMYGADTGMIEFPMLDGTVGGKELLQEIETELYAYGGRPHWGLLNFLSGANGLLAAMYPKLPQWLAVFQQLNPDGIFNNAFTERCGFSPHAFRRG
jgi:L-gulono-1,4-lactone dehydrogenase